ncbi:unnamed protein product, partial [Meganyctiphanes norvegica]
MIPVWRPRAANIQFCSVSISHFKGPSYIQRGKWVGVHGSPTADGSDGTSTAPLLTYSTPGSPQTPHIVVSPEDEVNSNNNIDLQSRKPLPSPSGTPQNGPYDQYSGNASSTPAPPPTPAPVEEKERDRERRPSKPERPDRLPLQRSSLDLPDESSPYQKTRQNTVKELIRQHSGDALNNYNSPSGGNGGSYLNIERSISRNSLSPSVMEWKGQGNDSLIACLSALYGKLLVVMGMAFPMAEVISTEKVPFTFYIGFYLYLYIGSILFLVYVYLFLLRTTTIPPPIKSKFRSLSRMASKDSRLSACSDAEADRASMATTFKTQNYKYSYSDNNNHGSMYLKMGAVLFGIGSMIYSGLEVGQFFELQADSDCANILLAISPGCSMLFTFIQMYFIFLNSRVAINKHRIIVRFGLMHMIGTNLCNWLNVLVKETKHEIDTLTLKEHGWYRLWKSYINDSDESVLSSSSSSLSSAEDFSDEHSSSLTQYDAEYTTPKSYHDYPGIGKGLQNMLQVINPTHNLVKRSSGHQAYSVYDCRRSDLMGKLVDNASPFLFPCTIEYSLLCAGVLYVIWRNSTKPVVNQYDNGSDISNYVARKARHHYSVDCAHASRGLFMGILVLVLTIISLILFFVLIDNEELKKIAVLEANIIELSLYGVAIITGIIGMVQMRELEFVPEGDVELDNILLLIAQTGVFVYASFTVIGSHFQTGSELLLPLITAIVTLTQTTVQTIFVLDASRRCCYTQDQLTRKPGREMVTFLLVCNLAMWAINTFETSRADAHPKQLEFYGIWAWTIISHISMPLAIFYRFHVTVCLCEIWKRSYKLKNDY